MFAEGAPVVCARAKATVPPPARADAVLVPFLDRYVGVPDNSRPLLFRRLWPVDFRRMRLCG